MGLLKQSKGLVITVGLFLLSVVSLLGQSKGPGLFVDICRFQVTGSGDPFVQVYTAVAGPSIYFVEEGENRFQGEIMISLRLSELVEGDTLTVESDSYSLKLPTERMLPDTTMQSRLKGTLLNVQQRRLDPGTYLLEVSAVDNHAPTPVEVRAINEFTMEKLGASEFAFSDVKWVAGKIPREDRRIWGRDDLIPLVTNNTFFNEDTLEFYQEIYNAGAVFEDKFYIRSVIYQGNNRLYNYETQATPREVRDLGINAFKKAIYIGNLSSNIYHLQVELLNARNRPVKIFRKKFYVYNSRREAEFEQSVAISNPDTDMFNQYSEEELDHYIRTLTYRATTQEQNFINALANYQQKKNYLYSFFSRRLDMNPGQTVQSMWNGHLAMVNYANQRFKATGVQGWQTDRGRVWLTYGAPSDVERYPYESGLVPYEVWRYNRLESQTNVVFIFADADRATGGYPLLHSTRYGEVNNPRWQEQLRAINGGRSAGNVDFERPVGSTLDPKLDIKN